MSTLQRSWKWMLLGCISIIVMGQVSGGIIEYWTPGQDYVIKNFAIVDLGMKVVPSFRCSAFPESKFIYGLADTIFVTPFSSDTLTRCIVFINDNPVTEDMFPNF